MTQQQSTPTDSKRVESRLEIMDLESGSSRVIYTQRGIFEAPNWHPHGNYLVFNQDGELYRIAPVGGTPERINSGFANRCNNDHGISPDGRQLVVSHHDEGSAGESVIYTLPIDGGAPRRVTDKHPSYWHGWSADGSTLAYVAGRENSEHYNIYTVSVNGGEETQLTATAGLDDGPDYSPDGRCIYFNSFRTGMMQIWRMDANGDNPIQLVFSPHSDWFPHPSPDGKSVVFIRYMEDQREDHPFGRDVKLVMLDLSCGEERDLTGVFYGGQGSLNVPSWAPDSRRFAFVSYRQL